MSKYITGHQRAISDNDTQIIKGIAQWVLKQRLWVKNNPYYLPAKVAQTQHDKIAALDMSKKWGTSVSFVLVTDQDGMFPDDFFVVPLAYRLGARIDGKLCRQWNPLLLSAGTKLKGDIWFMMFRPIIPRSHKCKLATEAKIRAQRAQRAQTPIPTLMPTPIPMPQPVVRRKQHGRALIDSVPIANSRPIPPLESNPQEPPPWLLQKPTVKPGEPMGPPPRPVANGIKTTPSQPSQPSQLSQSSQSPQPIRSSQSSQPSQSSPTIQINGVPISSIQPPTGTQGILQLPSAWLVPGTQRLKKRLRAPGQQIALPWPETDTAGQLLVPRVAPTASQTQASRKPATSTQVSATSDSSTSSQTQTVNRPRSSVQPSARGIRRMRGSRPPPGQRPMQRPAPGKETRPGRPSAQGQPTPQGQGLMRGQRPIRGQQPVRGQRHIARQWPINSHQSSAGQPQRRLPPTPSASQIQNQRPQQNGALSVTQTPGKQNLPNPMRVTSANPPRRILPPSQRGGHSPGMGAQRRLPPVPSIQITSSTPTPSPPEPNQTAPLSTQASSQAPPSASQPNLPTTNGVSTTAPSATQS